MIDGLLEVVEVDAAGLRKAEIVSEIRRESEIQRERGDLQKEAAKLEESINQFFQKTRIRINHLRDQERTCARDLASIDRMRDELLDTTPEGKRIRALLTEIQEQLVPA